MFYIVDDFYPDPDKIRKYALSCTFHNGTITDRVTNKIRKIMHPGARTKELDNENFIYLKNRMEQLLNRKIVRWYSKAKINTFVAIFPISKPKFVLVTLLDEPKISKDYVYKYRNKKGFYT